MTPAAKSGPRGGTRAAPTGRSATALARFHEEDRLGEAYDVRHLRRLLPYVRPEARLLAGSMALLVVNSALALGRPLIMGNALDAIGTPGGGAVLFRAGCLVAGLIVLEQLLAFPQMYAMQLAGARAMAELRRRIFRFLHRRTIGFYDRTPVGRLVTRVTGDVDAIGEMFASGALNAVGDLLRLVVIVGVMLWMDPVTSLIAFATLPPVALGVRWTRRRIRDAFREVRAKTARMNAYLNEQVSGMAVVQAYAREQAAADDFDGINLAYKEANNRSIVFDSTLDAAIEMVSSVCIASVLWFAGVRAHEQHVSFGTLFAFVAYIEMFFLPIRDLSARYSLVQSAMAGAERVFQLLDNEEEERAPPPAVEGADAVDPDAGLDADGRPWAFELRDVSFAYKPGVPVLTDVSLRARAGERIALVGATGAGKSTVTALLLRLYEATAGRVFVGGRDVRAYDAGDLRRRFAVVPQDVFLFPGTVASNVAAGDAEPDRAKVERALDRIGARAWFERREGGLDAEVRERGANFSAGERQLLAFARALYRDPPLLVLDEATANVDSTTEAQLQRALAGAMAGRTSLVVAHRLSTIKSADRIVVLHKGRVAEQGTHDELLAADGIYARLYRLQFAPRDSATRLQDSGP